MTYKEFLERIIDDGIAAAKKSYAEKKNKDFLEGSIAGFNACRNLDGTELVELYYIAIGYRNQAHLERADNYWYFNCYVSEVEWVINVVSAMMYNEGQQPLLSHLPTARGYLKAADILNNPAWIK